MARCLLLFAAAALLAGCQTERFRSRNLGDVTYEQAYQAGMDVFQKYYTVDTANAKSGRIVSTPKLADAKRTRLMYAGPAREKATMRIRQDGSLVWADVRVDVQRQEGEAYRSFNQLNSRNEVPNYTPAQDDAALTAEQQQAWVTTSQNYDTEQRMLTDVYEHLHPTSRPADEAAPAP